MYEVELSIVLSDSDLIRMVSQEFNLSWNQVCRLTEMENLFSDGYFVRIAVNSLERLKELHGEKLGFVFYELMKDNSVSEIYCYFDN